MIKHNLLLKNYMIIKYFGKENLALFLLSVHWNISSTISVLRVRLLSWWWLGGIGLGWLLVWCWCWVGIGRLAIAIRRRVVWRLCGETSSTPRQASVDWF